MGLRRFIATTFVILFVPTLILFRHIDQVHEQKRLRDSGTTQWSEKRGDSVLEPSLKLHLEARRRVIRSSGINIYGRGSEGNSADTVVNGPSHVSSKKRYTLEDLRKLFRHQSKKCPFRTKFNFSEVPLPKTALASFPGSGNTWLRHLLQQATGLYTGSIYCDDTLQNAGLGECLTNLTDRVLVEKVHEPNYRGYDRVVLLVRNPFDAIRSFFNYKFAGHKKALDRVPYQSKVWFSHVDESILDWKNTVVGWLQHFPSKDIHVISYENLLHDTVGELQDALTFLGMPVSPRILWCTFLNRHGRFKRLKKAALSTESLYPAGAKTVISAHFLEVVELLRNSFPQRQFTVQNFMQKSSLI
ncbi:hypothetical protein FSP39_011358 [Pinctada imbricata]|uniref:Sulfotransferase domain-containing protein n=1 Tax=Pinctada imbricata TaxID=66713 RepID=A0AA88YE32_PINIB|nr:hypothetical protein FSP39_011358 [Pinctada imbricata]